MHSDGGGQRGAAVLLLYTLTFGLSAGVCATAEEPDASDSAQRYGIDPARLGAVPAESRALFVEVFDRLETMRGEMDGLRADKAALAERVTRLEEKDCETLAEEKQEKEEDNGDEGAGGQLTQRATAMGTTNSTRRRAQAGLACERVRDFRALTAAAMDACCPVSGGGHRRMQASCDLPATCPVGGVRGGVRAIHDGLRGDGGGDAGRAGRGFPEPRRVVCRVAGRHRRNVAAGRSADVPCAGEYRRRGAFRRDVSGQWQR